MIKSQPTTIGSETKRGQKDRFSVKNYLNSLVSNGSNWLLEDLSSRLMAGKKTFLVTPNPEFLVYASDNNWFREILEDADYAIPDGVGLAWAGKILATQPLTRITGVDLMEKLCEEAAKRGWTVCFAGGFNETGEEALAVLQKKYPSLKGFALPLPVLSYDLLPRAAVREAINKINEYQPDLLFVALGMGKQEKFIAVGDEIDGLVFEIEIV